MWPKLLQKSYRLCQVVTNWVFPSRAQPSRSPFLAENRSVQIRKRRLPLSVHLRCTHLLGKILLQRSFEKAGDEQSWRTSLGQLLHELSRFATQISRRDQLTALQSRDRE